MICEPSVWPTFISPIVLTRQLFQPSVNFFEPISRLTVDCWRVDPMEQRAGELAVVGLQSLQPSQSFTSFASSPTLMTPNGSLSPDAQGDLTCGALQVLDVQRAAADGVEEHRQRLLEYLRGRKPDRVQIGEAPGKEILPACRYEPLIEHALNALDAPGAIGHVAGQEFQDLDDVRGIARGERLGHAAADENPQRLFDVEWPERAALLLVKPLLLKEGQQASDEIGFEVVGPASLRPD